jgi:hypothetical protein
MSPLDRNDKVLRCKDLTNSQTSLDRETDSKKSNQVPKQAEIDIRNLPAELAEIITVWHELPEHIKAAIKALVQTHSKGTK